ncbi:MAG TPA: SMC-Scp complex subunit ScpB [Nitrospiraceae bacterium]|nr:SMC-Scp complex subunit ScpB [Nitrospiraceae bacterium]
MLWRVTVEDREAKAAIEALLFVSGEPLTAEMLKNILETGERDIERLMTELISEYQGRASGILIAEVAHGYQMVTSPDYAEWVRKLLRTAVSWRLSQPAIETLAIIAYKQPVIKAEIESIRGVNSDGVLKTLLEKGLIKILGRKEVPGRPLMYGTSKGFLQYFGLKDLSELPTLRDFEEVKGAAS